MRRWIVLAACFGCGGKSELGIPIGPDASPEASTECSVTSDTVVVVSADDLGVVAMPSSITAVSGPHTSRFGDRVLWSFAEAVLDRPAANGDTWRSAIGAFSSPDDPLSPTFALDANGAPLELVPLDATERAFNQAHTAQRQGLVVWPTANASASDGSALVFYERLTIGPGDLNLAPSSTGIARLAPNETTAVRDPPLFVAPQPQFASGAITLDGYLYLYACTGGFAPTDGCRVARAPVDHAREQPAYRYWNGSDWSAVPASGVVVFDWVPGGATIAWHPHLGKFVASYTEPFATRTMVRTAPRPEGPWSAATPLSTTLPPTTFGTEQAVFAKDCGRDTIFTYVANQRDVHVVRVKLR